MPYVPPSYAPTTNPGDIRNRIWRMTLENPNSLENPDARMTATAHEQIVVRVHDADRPERTIDRARNLSFTYTDPDETLPMRNPVDGSIIGTMTAAQVLVAIYSLGYYILTTDDARQAAEAAAAEAAAAEAAAG
jgi:hypothetical protein